jgi:hypothetical protein
VAQVKFCEKAMKLRVYLCKKLLTNREIQPIQGPCGLRRGRLSLGIVCSNPAEFIIVSSLVFVECCVGSGLFDGLITRSGESYRARACVCLIVCDLETSKQAA